MKASVINVFVSDIHFLRLLSAGDWGPPCVSRSEFTAIFAKKFGALFGGEDKDEMSWAHFGSGRYRFELSSM